MTQKTAFTCDRCGKAIKEKETRVNVSITYMIPVPQEGEIYVPPPPPVSLDYHEAHIPEGVGGELANG
jgi:hypothetical protein